MVGPEPAVPLSIGRSSASAPSSHDLSLAAFTINIAESDFRHAQVPARSWGRYREPREHCAVVDFKLLVNVVEVHFNGAVGNIQLPRNCLVR
jgi:hypothetical protein